MDKIITINVGGKVYQTVLGTLLKIPYFANMIEGCENDNIDNVFVDRSDVVFDHVLAYVRDAKHPFPAEYAYELDFYGIEYDESKLYNALIVVKKQVDDIKLYLRSYNYALWKKCGLCHEQTLMYNTNILCLKCVGTDRCIFSNCHNKTLKNYCTIGNHNTKLCNKRGCGNMKFKDLNVCYKCMSI